MLRNLLDNNVAWASRQTRADPDYSRRFADLQHSEYLWIGCADSRVPANVITGAVQHSACRVPWRVELLLPSHIIDAVISLQALTRRYITRLLPLTLLSPDIQGAILESRQAQRMMLKDCS